MTDLDLTRYEGHTAGPWSAVEWTDETPYPAGAMVAVQRGDTHDGKGRVCEMIGQGNGRYEPEVTAANARLIADAPLLLAEVRRLREAIRVQANAVRVIDQKERAEYVATATLDSHREANAILTTEVEALRQSHARLLAAVKRLEPSLSTIDALTLRQQRVLAADLRAAVAEAEVTRGE